MLTPILRPVNVIVILELALISTPEVVMVIWLAVGALALPNEPMGDKSIDEGAISVEK
jgi:hypothetical protein